MDELHGFPLSCRAKGNTGSDGGSIAYSAAARASASSFVSRQPARLSAMKSLSYNVLFMF
jgi:hypothetical protein